MHGKGPHLSNPEYATAIPSLIPMTTGGTFGSPLRPELSKTSMPRSRSACLFVNLHRWEPPSLHSTAGSGQAIPCLREGSGVREPVHCCAAGRHGRPSITSRGEPDRPPVGMADLLAPNERQLGFSHGVHSRLCRAFAYRIGIWRRTAQRGRRLIRLHLRGLHFQRLGRCGRTLFSEPVHQGHRGQCPHDEKLEPTQGHQQVHVRVQLILSTQTVVLDILDFVLGFRSRPHPVRANLHSVFDRIQTGYALSANRTDLAENPLAEELKDVLQPLQGRD